MKSLSTFVLGVVGLLASAGLAWAHPGHGIDAAHVHGEQIVAAWATWQDLSLLALVVGGAALGVGLLARQIAKGRRTKADPWGHEPS